MKKYVIFFILLGIALISYGESLPLQSLKLPPRFSINIYADPIPDAREMVLGSKNIVFIGSKSEGKVYAVVPDKRAPHKTTVLTIASGLKMPNGVAFYQKNLYVVDINQVLRFDDIENHLSNPPKPIVLVNNLPTDKDHGWRYIRIGADKKLYIAVGAPCNACLSEDPRFATIMRMNLDGTHPEIYARGIRNSVGFDWDPSTHELVFTDNGRDWMGENTPPDELNYASKINQNFGFPYCHGKNISDPKYGKNFPCSAFIPPVLELPAHVATLGMKFYTGKMFPKTYQNQIFIAEHGSWNRIQKIGYQVIAVSKKNNTFTAKPFINGWLNGNSAWGRPVDLLVLPDGSLLISDDKAGVIYRVSYQRK